MYLEGADTETEQDGRAFWEICKSEKSGHEQSWPQKQIVPRNK